MDSKEVKEFLTTQLGEDLTAWCKEKAAEYRSQASKQSMEQCFALSNKADGLEEVVYQLKTLATQAENDKAEQNN